MICDTKVRLFVNLKFLNKLKQLTYTQKLAQRPFLFNYVRILNYTFILLLRGKKDDFPDLWWHISFKCVTTFSKPANGGFPVIL